MSDVPLTALIGPLVTLLVGMGAAVCCPLSPPGRRVLTGSVAALFVLSGAMSLVLRIADSDIRSTVRFILPGSLSPLAMDILAYLPWVLAGAGLVLLAFAATRGLPRPPAGPAPYGARPPAQPYPHGPAQH